MFARIYKKIACTERLFFPDPHDEGHRAASSARTCLRAWIYSLLSDFRDARLIIRFIQKICENVKIIMIHLKYIR
jgi:hypothetical protein